MSGSVPNTARSYRGQGAEERRARRRAKLIEAGLDLLGSEGWPATTVTAVCQRARLTPRYFYESFADRDELLVAIFDEIVGEVIRTVAAAQTTTPVESLRATVTAFVTMAKADPRKARAAFIEAFGSEALMRRRFERMHWYADRLAEQAAAGRRLGRRQARKLQTACLLAAGGLIEMMVAWLEGELDASPQQLIDDYTVLATASLRAAGYEPSPGPS
jgi:AcrR family transcriptional regulator